MPDNPQTKPPASWNQVNSAELAQQNYWRGITALSGTAELENPTAYAGGANQAAGTIASLSEANSRANQVGFGNTFLNSFGSAAGKLLGGGNNGNPFATGG